MQKTLRLKRYPRQMENHAASIPAQYAPYIAEKMRQDAIPVTLHPWETLKTEAEPPLSPQDAMVALDAFQQMNIISLAPTVIVSPYTQDTMYDIVRDTRECEDWLDEQTSHIADLTEREEAKLLILTGCDEETRTILAQTRHLIADGVELLDGMLMDD